MKISGKIALITGAGQRIGREIALALARTGAAVVIHYHRSHKEAQTLAKEISKMGNQAFLVSCDFSERKSMSQTVANFVREVYKLVPRVDILINNASVFYPTSLGRISEESWDHLLDVNLKAPFFLSQEIGKQMFKNRSGKIINLIDAAAFRAAANYLPYAISKVGLAHATAGLANAFAPYVQVNAVAPGPILPSQGMTVARRKTVTQRTLAKRFGDPKDIAEAVKFLIEGSDFITGVTIPVDGGLSVSA